MTAAAETDVPDALPSRPAKAMPQITINIFFIMLVV